MARNPKPLRRWKKQARQGIRQAWRRARRGCQHRYIHPLPAESNGMIWGRCVYCGDDSFVVEEPKPDTDLTFSEFGSGPWWGSR